jgi:hypothetical protein
MKAPNELWNFCFLNGNAVIREMWTRFTNLTNYVNTLNTSNTIECFFEFCSKEEHREGTGYPWEKINIKKLTETTCIKLLINAMKSENYLLVSWIRDAILSQFDRIQNDVYKKHIEIFKTELYGKHHFENRYVKARKWMHRNSVETHEFCVYKFARGSYKLDEETLEIILKL